MAQYGGASKRKQSRLDDEGTLSTPPPKVQKGHLSELFVPFPVDTSVEKSRWESYYQSQSTTNPLEITVPRSRGWIDMTMITLEYEVEFLNNDGSALLTELNKVFPVNNIGHSLIKQFDLKINNESVGETSESYHLKAYFARVLNHSAEEKATWLTSEGWATDTAGKFDNTDPHLTPIAALDNNEVGTITTALNALHTRPTPNEGAAARHKLCIAPHRKVRFIITPIIDIFQCSKYLPPGCQLDFRIRWNSPNLALMTGDPVVTAPRFRIVPNSPVLKIRHVEAQPELHLYNESSMLNHKKMAVYPCMTSRIATHTIVDGRRKTSFKNVWQGFRPNYMIIGFQEGTAFTGAYDKNVFNFKDMHQEMVRVTLDGQEIPMERIFLNSFDKVEGYETLSSFSGNMKESASIGISRSDYKDGNYLLAFNFNPDGRQNHGYNYGRNLGIVNIDVDFDQDTAGSTTLVAYGEFENALWIDGNKNVSMKYSY